MTAPTIPAFFRQTGHQPTPDGRFGFAQGIDDDRVAGLDDLEDVEGIDQVARCQADRQGGADEGPRSSCAA